MKTTAVGEDSRLITVTSDPSADEPTPEMERDGTGLEAHCLLMPKQSLKVAFLYFSDMMSRIVKKSQESIFHSGLFRSAFGEF